MTAEERKEKVQRECDDYNKEQGTLEQGKDGYDCPKCKNKGYNARVRETQYADGSINDYTMELSKCSCSQTRKSIMRLKNSGLQDVIEKWTFDRYNALETWQKNIKETAIKFNNEQNGVFFIGGQSGAGKSHICTAITGEFLKQGKSAYYMLWQEEIVKLNACVTNEEYQAKMNELKSIDVLYIDDFFKPVGENPKPTTADIKRAYELINYRYNRGKGITIISSELYIQEILNIDEATGGRIIEYAGAYMLNIQRDKKRNYRLRHIQEV